MNMDITPNSHKYKKELQNKNNSKPKKIEKVVKGKVKTKKKNKLAGVFISEDASNVKSYVFMDVLVPAIKQAVADIVKDGINIILYGDTGRRSSSGNSQYVSYRDYTSRYGNNNRYRERQRMSSSRRMYDDIILESRGEAEDVLDRMCEIIDSYDFVTVTDLYDLVGITGNFTYSNYGWSNLRTAEVIRVHDGYMLKLPKAQPRD